MTEKFTGFNPEEHRNSSDHAVTPEAVRAKADFAMKQCKEIITSGKDILVNHRENHPDEEYIIAGTHFTGLDVQTALSQLGDHFDIQVTGESLVKDEFLMKKLIDLIGPDRFSDLQYKKTASGKKGVFNPENFEELEEKMKEGRTPWMAIHPYTRSKGMLEGRIGAAYLALKTDAWVVPSSVALEGGPMNLDTPVEFAQQALGRLRGKTKANYYIGEPFKLKPIDNLEIIGSVLEKRSKGIKPTPEERNEFSKVHQELKDRSKQIIGEIMQILPEEYHGIYKENPTAE